MSTRARTHKTKTFKDLKKEKGYKRPTWGKEKTEVQKQLESRKAVLKVAKEMLAGRGKKTGKYAGLSVEAYLADETRREKRGARGKLMGLKLKLGGSPAMSDEFESSIPGDAAQSFFGTTGGLGSPYNSPSSSPRSGPVLIRTATPVFGTGEEYVTKRPGGKGGKKRTTATTRSQARGKKSGKQGNPIDISDTDDEGALPPKRPRGGGRKPPPGGGGPPKAPVKAHRKKKKKKDTPPPSPSHSSTVPLDTQSESDEKAPTAKPQKAKAATGDQYTQFAAKMDEKAIDHYLTKVGFADMVKQTGMGKYAQMRVRAAMRMRRTKLRRAGLKAMRKQGKKAVQKLHQVAVKAALAPLEKARRTQKARELMYSYRGKIKVPGCSD